MDPKGRPGAISWISLTNTCIADVMDNSLVVHRNGIVDCGVTGAAVGSTFQFVRGGYYSKDADSTDAVPVFNLTIGLKGEGKK